MAAFLLVVAAFSLPADPNAYPNQLYPEDVAAMAEQPSPAYDPCPPSQDAEQNARCWIWHAFPEGEREVALAVARRETGCRPFDPEVRYGDCGRIPGVHSTATGLFQHLESHWDGPKAFRADRFYPGEEMVITNGWHNTLVAARLVEADGWNRHWQVCRGFEGPRPGTLRC